MCNICKIFGMHVFEKDENIVCIYFDLHKHSWYKMNSFRQLLNTLDHRVFCPAKANTEKLWTQGNTTPVLAGSSLPVHHK